jgi:GT2 family glycosyltransferase
MVYGQGIAISGQGEELYELLPQNHQEHSDPNALLMDCYIPSPGSSLIRRSILDRVGFFEESFRSGQDHDLAVRIMEYTRTAYLPEVSVYYRKHKDSISSKGTETRWKTGFEILRRAENRYPYERSTIRKRKAVLNFRLGQTYWKQSRIAKSAPYLLKSLLFDPARALRVAMGREKVR